MRKKWTDDLIDDGLREISKSYGRMPSAKEMRAHGANDLACAVSRRVGYLKAAHRLGLKIKGSETHRAQAIESLAAAYLAERGYRVDRQTCKAPFDLLVNGEIRVDVKSGKRTAGGYVFAGIKNGADCDVFMLCGVDDSNAMIWRYFVPASEARVQTISIRPTGKYGRFRENLAPFRSIDGKLP